MTDNPTLQSEKLEACDYRKPGCAAYGQTIGTRWVCNNHICERLKQCWLNSRAPVAPQEDSLTETIRGFINLQQNWDSYNAPPINPETIEVALALAPVLSGWQAVPRSDGGIQFERGDHEIVIDTSPPSPPSSPVPQEHYCPHDEELMTLHQSFYRRCARCDYQEGVASAGLAPVDGEQDALVDEVHHRIDQVVEAAVEWHQAGREGGEWFEAAEKLGAAIDSLLELRDTPQGEMPRRWCSVHQREEFKYESLEHELHASNAVSVNPEYVKWKCPKCGWRKAQSVPCERCHAWCENVTTSLESIAAEECSCGTEKDAGGCPNGH